MRRARRRCCRSWRGAIPSLDLRLAAPLYLVGLFVACMVCHGELARLKPDPAHLTRFYLMISLGGALGAVLVGDRRAARCSRATSSSASR